jgi:hypothetical protein
MGQPEHKEECMDQMLNLLEAGEVEFTDAERTAFRAEAERLGFRLSAAI